ncbi:biopolymer transporter ExbD [Aureisphaera galaxeae]|uniref:ExbD/TolR family protein n=1 Tax=Aureisphaera galaxeae TaxID=1538023 RepID=UPI0023509B3A|nr:biopolymer transporter ExbD [Aureisphaera galaxeae]MDC8003721.1 biopolymer transporter ExbD [Aureisphaera galaxeae]
MKRLFFFGTVLVMILSSCDKSHSQERVEDRMMECMYAAYEDNGAEFKQAMKDFEAELIQEQIIPDGTGKGYRSVYQKMAAGEDLGFGTNLSFTKLVRGIGAPNMDSIELCQSRIMDMDSLSSEDSKLQKLLNIAMDNNVSDTDAMAKSVLSILDEKDFELDYYKMVVFFMVETISYVDDSGITRRLPPKTKEPDYDPNDALEIRVTENEELFIGDEDIALSKLRSKVIAHIKQAPLKSVVSIANDRLVPYTFYIAVQNEVVAAYNFLRDEEAQKRFGKVMSDLTEEEQKLIKTEIPLNLVENVNE